MSIVCRCFNFVSGKILTEGTLSPCQWFVPFRSKFTKVRVQKEIFEERSKEHEKYGGDPEQPHKLHVVTRVKGVMRRPYWEKKMIKDFGLEKVRRSLQVLFEHWGGNTLSVGLGILPQESLKQKYNPVIHKNTPSVNSQLKFIKHLVRIQPLKTPYGLPAEEDMANTYINSKGELIVQRLLKPIDPKAIDC